jgi:hypothetical protein
MRVEEWIILIVLAFICYRPEKLQALDTLSGRLLMLVGIIFLAQRSAILGIVAAIAMTRVLDRDPKPPLWRPSTDLVGLENILRPQNSAMFPTLRTSAVPINDVYEPFTFF